MDAGGGASELGLLGAGSGRLLKHGRGNAAGGEDHGWVGGGGRAKQARTASVVNGDVAEAAAKAAAPFLLGSCGGPGHGGERMLSFSSAAAAPDDGGAMPPLYYGTPASCSGLMSSASLSSSMQGARVRGPFTPPQWIELEHQALIYKYLTANSPVPHSLLVPIRRSGSLASSPYPPPYFGTSKLGWGSFQLGYSGNADLEPGRCRRTDGKKWRCSRDAVADQKYCERHMNRGRHRSRKHVEGQPGHAAKAMSAVAVAAAAAAAAATQHAAALAGVGATAAAGLAVNQHRQPGKSYATGATDPCSLQYSRGLANKLSNERENMQDSDNVSMLTSMNTGNTAGSVFPFSKQNTDLFEVSSSRPEFGLVPSDSLTSSPHSSLKSVKNLLSSRSLSERHSSASMQHFVDWPRTPPAQGGLSWPEAEDMPRAQRSQLSVSAPMASSELLSSASTSPIHDHEKLILSPLKLGREYSGPACLVSAAASRDEVSQLEATWATMFRDSSTGGPLGEVLAKNNSYAEARSCPSAAPRLTDYYCWDSGHGMQSSPVGVLQRTTAFGSVSSSTGSSPRVENHGACCDGTSNLMDDDLGSVVVSHPSIRLL